jgi:hypothetical protein
VHFTKCGAKVKILFYSDKYSKEKSTLKS